jgi:hypothetical protein
MSTEATRRAVAKFLAEDITDLNKLHFLRRLASLARGMGRGRAVPDDDRESALLLVAQQSPHRSWNRSRFSEARLVFDCYREYDGVVEELTASGQAFTWHDVMSALRQRRRGEPIYLKKKSGREHVRKAIADFAKRHGLMVESCEHKSTQIRVVFIVGKSA